MADGPSSAKRIKTLKSEAAWSDGDGGDGASNPLQCFERFEAVVETQTVEIEYEPVAAAADDDNEKLRVEDALLYLNLVKCQFPEQPWVYHDFLDTMEQFKQRRMNTAEVIASVFNLLRSHIELIIGFNTFLPPDHKIVIKNGHALPPPNPFSIDCTIEMVPQKTLDVEFIQMEQAPSESIQDRSAQDPLGNTEKKSSNNSRAPQQKDKKYIIEYRANNQTVLTGQGDTLCHLCQKVFKTTRGLHAHLAQKHHAKRTVMYRCAKCQFETEDKEILRNHIDAHIRQCQHCLKYFKDAESLDFHKQPCDSDLKCAVCKKKFKCQGQQSDHNQTPNVHD